MNDSNTKRSIKYFLTNYKLAYLTVIFIFAVMTFTFYILIESNNENGRKLNIAGKQRVISQRSIFLIKSIVYSSNALKASDLTDMLKQEVASFKQHNSEILKNNNKPFLNTSLNINSNDLKNIKKFIFKIEYYYSLLDKGEDDQVIKEFEVFSDFVFYELYSSLDNVVLKLQYEDKKKYSLMVAALFLLMLMGMALVVCSVRFVYQPLSKNLTMKGNRLKKVKKKLYKKSKSLRSAQNQVIRNSNVDILNIVNTNLRHITEEFAEILKGDNSYFELSTSSRRELDELTNLIDNFTSLSSLKQKVQVVPLDLNQSIYKYFSKDSIKFHFDHEITFEGNSFLMGILFKELNKYLHVSKTIDTNISIEHVNDNLYISLVQAGNVLFSLCDSKIKMFEFLAQKNGAKVIISDNRMTFDFETKTSCGQSMMSA